jgi:predicted transcriptional regulator
MLKDEPLGDDDQLVNRPDWQAAVEAGRKARAEGNVTTHEDVLAWRRTDILLWRAK